MPAATAVTAATAFETRGRSMAKAISWRILAATITGIVALVMTHQLAFAAKIGMIGRIAAPDYEV